jgi:hypothetical protein
VKSEENGDQFELSTDDLMDVVHLAYETFFRLGKPGQSLPEEDVSSTPDFIAHPSQYLVKSFQDLCSIDMLKILIQFISSPMFN